jgi:hypothetical protein
MFFASVSGLWWGTGESGWVSDAGGGRTARQEELSNHVRPCHAGDGSHQKRRPDSSCRLSGQGDPRHRFVGKGGSLAWAKQKVDGRLSGNFGNQVCPSLSERTIAQRYGASPCAEHLKISAAFDLKRHVKHVLSDRIQFDMNLETAIRDYSVHERRSLSGCTAEPRFDRPARVLTAVTDRPDGDLHQIEYRFCGPRTYRLFAISTSFSRNSSNAVRNDRSSDPSAGCRPLSVAVSTSKVISRESSYPQKNTQCLAAS